MGTPLRRPPHGRPSTTGLELTFHKKTKRWKKVIQGKTVYFGHGKNPSDTPAPSTHTQAGYNNRGDRRETRSTRHNTARRRSSNGRNGHDRSTDMTQSQRRAIESIARRLGLDPEAEIDQEFGWSFNDLTLREASRVIDHLKGLQSHEERDHSAPENGGSQEPADHSQGGNGRSH
ncbi:MAG: hypothetical protein GC164_10270 [Phycisphaera sp.]|nr:hypothetical protein [Phycisphaera sp.]